MGWDGEVADKTNPYSWNLSNWPTSSLADGRWHRLEVTWTPDTASNTGNLNYTIYKQGHEGPVISNIVTIAPKMVRMLSLMMSQSEQVTIPLKRYLVSQI